MKEEDMTSTEHTKKPTDLNSAWYGLCLAMLLITLAIVFLTSWFSAYEKWGTTGILYNGAVWTIISGGVMTITKSGN